MIRIKPFKQSKGFCGPASLKMVLHYWGLNKTERELGELSGCTTECGVEAEGLLRAARKLGFKGRVKDRANINDLRKYVIDKKMPVIVDWFSTDEGHYSVVVNITDDKIYMMDPELKKIRSLTLDAFKRVWFDFSGKYLSPKSSLLFRRMLVIYK